MFDVSKVSNEALTWPFSLCISCDLEEHSSTYRVSQRVLAGSTGQNNHNGSWWVGWVYPRVVYHSKTFYFCGPLGRKYFQKKINLVSVETDFNFLYCDPSAQPIDTINGGMG